nr:hypothetical protein GCM10020092_007210 [Actinoplanes digitatis]
MARRGEVSPDRLVCALTAADGAGRIDVLPADPPPAAQQPTDLVLAEASGRSAAPVVDAQRRIRARRRRRPVRVVGRALRAALSRKLGVAVLVTLIITVVSGAVLVHADPVDGFWQSIYVTLLTVVGSSDVEVQRNEVAQAAQLVLTIAGLALLPLVTAAVVEGMVNARLELNSGRVAAQYEDHVVVVGLGSVGTRVLRQLNDLGVDVVAIDRRADARGSKAAQQLGVPFIVGDAAREETLRAASIATSRALVVVSTDDVTNLQAALNARAVRPDLRVVLRLFDDDFAQRVQTAFNIDISRSVSLAGGADLRGGDAGARGARHHPGRPARAAGRRGAGLRRFPARRADAEPGRPAAERPRDRPVGGLARSGWTGRRTTGGCWRRATAS